MKRFNAKFTAHSNANEIFCFLRMRRIDAVWEKSSRSTHTAHMFARAKEPQQDRLVTRNQQRKSQRKKSRNFSPSSHNAHIQHLYKHSSKSKYVPRENEKGQRQRMREMKCIQTTCDGKDKRVVHN